MHVVGAPSHGIGKMGYKYYPTEPYQAVRGIKRPRAEEPKGLEHANFVAMEEG
jgi:hypothetical protein